MAAGESAAIMIVSDDRAALRAAKTARMFTCFFAKRVPGAPHQVLLVLDATTGQNGLQQAQQFTDALDVSGIILTKLDGTAKGGMIVAIQRQLGIPIKMIGVGELVAKEILENKEAELLKPFRFNRYEKGKLHPTSNSPFPWS